MAQKTGVESETFELFLDTFNSSPVVDTKKRSLQNSPKMVENR